MSHRFFHHSATELKVGDVLRPGHPDAVWGKNFYPAGQRWRAEKVWMFGSPQHAAIYGGSRNVYRVEPAGPVGIIAERPYAGDDEDLDSGITGDQFYADSAIVVAVLEAGARATVLRGRQVDDR